MGFMDKVKAQATTLAEKAQEGAKAGQAKLSDLQAKKHADALLLEFGGLVYVKQAGRGTSDGDARAEAVLAELQQFEAQNGPITVTSAQPAPPPPSGTSYVPGTGGDPQAATSFIPGSGNGAETPPPSESAPTPTAVPGDTGIPQSGGPLPTGSYASDAEES